jgi:hypothetical protein
MKYTQIVVRILGLAIAIITLATGSVSLYARLADVVYEPNPIVVPATRTEPFTVYFPYGNPNSDLDIRNAAASLSLTGDGFELVTTGFADLYNGSPTRTDSENPPAIADCTNPTALPTYPISSTLASATSLTYGLQSARSLDSQSGNNSETLREKHTGCIRVQVKVKAGATDGQTAQLLFDQDSATSPDYQESRRPGRGIYNLRVSGSTTPTCSDTQELINGQCVTKCESGQTRDTNGTCVTPAPTCDSNTQDLVNNQCVPKCAANQVRDASGTCVSNTPNCDSTTQDLVNGQCVAKCAVNQSRNTSGVCANNTPTCNNTQDLINNQCVPKCNAGQTRSTTTGQCISMTSTASTTSTGATTTSTTSSTTSVTNTTGGLTRTGGAEILAAVIVLGAGIVTYTLYRLTGKKFKKIEGLKK